MVVSSWWASFLPQAIYHSNKLFEIFSDLFHVRKNGRWCFREATKIFEHESSGNLETLENILLLFNILFLSTSSHAFYLFDGSHLNACWKPLSFLFDNFCSEIRKLLSVHVMLREDPEERGTLKFLEIWTSGWVKSPRPAKEMRRRGHKCTK